MIQWCLYYPGVLNLNDLGLSSGDRAMHRSRPISGRSAGGAEEFRAAGSRAASVYHAGLYLVVGQVDKAERLFARIPAKFAGKEALKTLIAAVNLQERDTKRDTEHGERMAGGVLLRTVAAICGRAPAAEEATKADPSFGFAWTRVAELHFSFGRTPQAKSALERGCD